MVIFNYKCLVCKEAFMAEGRIQGWHKDLIKTTLNIKIVLSPKQRMAGNNLLCSEECYTTFLDTQKRANEAYEAIMADFDDE